MKKPHPEYPWIMKRAIALGLTQKEAAKKCSFNDNYFNKTIKGMRPLNAQEALKISRGLDMSLYEVITGQKDDSLESELKEVKGLLKRMQEREFKTAPHLSQKHDRANRPV